MDEDCGYPLAPLGRRACAWLLDAALGTALAIALAKLTGAEHDLRTLWHLAIYKSVGGTTGRQLSAAIKPGQTSLSALRPIAGLLAIVAAIAVGSVAYRVVTTALWGAGIGKHLLGLRVVVDAVDGPGTVVPGWARSWKRWVVPQAPGLIPLPATGLLAYLPALRDPRRRGLHDRAAGTIVIDLRAPLITPPPAATTWQVSSLDGYVATTDA